MEMNTAHPTASGLPVHSRMAYPQQVPGVSAITTTTAVVNAGVQKSIYSAPASPAYPASGERGTEASAHAAPVPSCLHPPPSTPKKDHLEDAGMLRKIRELLMSPGGCKLETLRLEGALEEAVNVIKDRYLISLVPNNISAASAAKTPASYRHLIDLSAGSLKCTDVFTEEHFLCKIINEPLHKVQLAYFNLQQDSERSHCELYGHKLIRDVRDVVRMSKERTYVIIPAAVGEDGGMHAAPDAKCMYEDLHTYIRNKKKRLTESEARPLFHQICQTVMVCHRNGVVLRDLKLKRFYFIDEARTKLQYESLEGSMILDNPDNDVLSDKIGCPLYTAPELLCPNPTYNGKPADMWSLGVILYTMLVGQYPFYEKGNWSLIRVIRHGNVHIPAHLSRPVRYLLLSLLHKNHTERLPIEYIFLSPWLKMTPTLYVPVDAVIPDDESDDEQSGATMEPLDYSCATKTQSMQPDIDEQQQQQQQHYSNDDDVEMG